MTDKIKNLLLRSLTGIVFVAVLIGGFLYGALTFAILFALIAILATCEFAQVVNKQDRISINTFISCVATAYLFFAFFGYCSNLTPSAVFIPLSGIDYLPADKRIVPEKESTTQQLGFYHAGTNVCCLAFCPA